MEEDLGFLATARPRLINGLILLGFGLVALPLLVAIVWAAFQMDRLTRDSEQLVLVGGEAIRLSQEMIELIPDPKRTGRLYSLLEKTAQADCSGVEKKNTAKPGRFTAES